MPKGYSFSNRNNFMPNALGGMLPRTLKEALGVKGAPIALAEAYQGANPHFDNTGTWAEYTANCQRCVVAYELRRRGYDVTALPTYKGDTLQRVVYQDAKSGVINGRWLGAFQGAKPVNVGARSGDTTSKVVSNIREKMVGYGNGSRAVVQVFWKSGGGHVFNVENVNGTIRYVDAQTGKPHNAKKVISQARPGSINLVRTDNLRISERAKNFVS